MQLGAASSSSWLAAGAVGEESAPLWRLLCQQIPACLGWGPGTTSLHLARAEQHGTGGQPARLSLELCSFFLIQSELSEKKI